MKTMKTISKTVMVIGIIGAFVSCKSSFDATETMELQNNRQAVYQEIISNPEQMKEFTQMAQEDQGARKIMMQSHMEMMESGKLMEMMKNNPEMKKNMQNMMQNNPEMMEKMQSKMTEKMMKSAEGRKKLMKAMKENPEMKKEMMQETMKNMHNEGMMDKKENDKQ